MRALVNFIKYNNLVPITLGVIFLGSGAACRQDVQKAEVMRVSKPDLGPYRDLGVYVTQQLKQILDRELAYLRQVQEKERKQVSQAVVATTYGGLIGQFLDTNMETLPGYTPVVVAPPEVAGQPSSGSNEQGAGGSSGTTG